MRQIVEDFNRQTLEDANAWQKDYYPNLRKENRNTTDNPTALPSKDNATPITFYYESYSRGLLSGSVKRYYQALKFKVKNVKNGAYGIECNATTIYYMLQSYYLLPDDMTRVEFEAAFTPLNSNEVNTELEPKDYHLIVKELHKNIEEEGYIVANNIIFKGDNATLKKDLFKDIKLFGNLYAEYLKGSLNHIPPIHPNSSNATETLSNILWAFYLLRESGLYGTAYKNYILPNWDNKPSIINVYKYLSEGMNGIFVSENDLSYKKGMNKYIRYFTHGLLYQANSIYVGIKLSDDDPNKVDHFALIVNGYIDSFIHKGKKYFLYPADDSLGGETLICVPHLNFKELDTVGISMKMRNRLYTLKRDEGADWNRYVYPIYKEFALGFDPEKFL